MTFDPESVRAFEHARWEKAADVYASTFAPATSQFIDALLDAVGIEEGTQLLDVACGPGLVAARAANLGALVAGLDFSAAMIRASRAAHPQIEFDHGDAEELPYPSASFSAVVSNFGLHHVPRPELALKEAFRVLRAGGRIAFTVWADASDNIAWKLLFHAIGRHGDRAASIAPPPGGGFGADRCAQVLQKAGFIDTRTVLERRQWCVADAATLVSALRAGTARMAAMIESQDPSIMPAVLADVDKHARRWRNNGALALPIAAVIASGQKP
ncbi:MAG: methyltransferase domain-containing protein [Acetobacteraceae bacterium]|nr:methyltransferase domain-containing protein [Acetobacteraceae bacterium]